MAKRLIFEIILVLIFTFIGLTKTGRVFAEEKIAETSSNIIANNQKLDERVKKLRIFLKKNKSPLKNEAKYFVEAADKYSLDWRLVAAISGVESSFGKRIPKNSYNAWGFGIPTGRQSGIAFDSWKEGIEIVSFALKEKYIDKGADNIYKIGRVYAPPSKTWANNVLYFMKKIEEPKLKPELSI